MKRFLKSTVAAGIALSMIGAPLAMAQSDQHPGSPPHNDAAHANGPQHPPEQHAAITHPPAPHMVANNTAPRETTHNAHVQVSHEEQHPGPPPMQHQGPPPMEHQAAYNGHQWHNGDHYTGSRHYVSNWNSYHLNAPPQGYQWVQDGSQFVLIAVASGIIANVILSAAQ